MLHAIIDLGTNTFNLLIIEVGIAKPYKIVFHDKASVKLGQDCIDKNLLSDVAIERALNGLKHHLSSIKKYNVTSIRAVATSAIRSAHNKTFFLQKVKDELGLEIEIISGDTEAELIYHGVKQAVDLGEGKNLIMDIGGGSTEFIIADKSTIFWKHSFNLGISRLIEKFKPKNPILQEEIIAIENYLLDELKPLFEASQKFKFTTLIGSSGSFDTLADMILYRSTSNFLPLEATTYNFDLAKYYDLHVELLQSTYEQRLAMKGMLNMRADMIVVGSIFVHLVLNKLRLSEMKLSTYALKEGLALQYC